MVDFVVKKITSISHFRLLCDEFHNVYAHAPKRLLELQNCARELSTQFLKIGKILKYAGRRR